MYLLKLFFIFLPVFLMACTSPPQAVDSGPLPEEAPQTNVTETADEPAVNTDPVTETVSREYYDQTLADVRQFINRLNAIIANNNYNGWRNALSDEYYALISSPEYLASRSEEPGLKTRRIVLRTVNDYFIHVVVPSRADSRVDEIEFAADHIVKAFYLDTSARRLRVYELRKIDNDWKIVN